MRVTELLEETKYTQEWIKLSNIVEDVRIEESEKLRNAGAILFGMDITPRTILYGHPGINDIEFGIDIIPSEEDFSFSDLIDDDGDGAESINKRVKIHRTKLSQCLVVALDRIAREMSLYGADKFLELSYTAGFGYDSDQHNVNNASPIGDFDGDKILRRFENSNNRFSAYYNTNMMFEAFRIWFIFPNGVTGINRNERGL